MRVFPFIHIVYHKVFSPSKEVAKVNMEQVTRFGHHNIIIVSVTDSLNGTNHKQKHTLRLTKTYVATQ